MIKFSLLIKKLSYGLNCKKNIESKNSKDAKTKNGRIILLTKCGVCDSRKLKFIKSKKLVD